MTTIDPGIVRSSARPISSASRAKSASEPPMPFSSIFACAPVVNVGEKYDANVWHTDRIARIAPASGRVVGWIDLQGLLPKVYQLDPEAVLNGIAYDAARDRLFVTGKLWPKLFEIKVERQASQKPQTPVR
jgi:glutamine cyclotransferase